jgi:hypothetical protein
MAGRSPKAKRELDGSYARINGPQKPPSDRHLIALWVQEWSIRLRRLGSSFEDIATELTLAGQGKGTMIGAGINARRLVDLPPDVTFPPGYQIGRRAVLKAFRNGLNAGVRLAVEELRMLSHDRLATLYRSTQGGVARGDCEAIRAAVRVIGQHARIFGYAEPDDKSRAEREAQRERQEIEEHEAQMARVRALTIEEREQSLALCEKADTRLAAAQSRSGKPVIK